MLKKLYEKSEIWFAVAWIIAYVVLASTGDNISADLGIDKIVTLPVLIAMSAILYFFVRKNSLTEKYGCSVTQAVMGYFRFQPFTCVPLYATSKPEHLADVCKTLEVPFTAEDYAEFSMLP